MTSLVKNRSPPLSPLLVKPPKKYFKMAQIRPAAVENYANMDESEDFSSENHRKRLKVDKNTYQKVLTRSPSIEMSASTSGEEEEEENYCTSCDAPLLPQNKFLLPQHCSICMYNVCLECIRTCNCCGIETFCSNCCTDFDNCVYQPNAVCYKRCRECSKCSFEIADDFACNDSKVHFFCTGLANSIYYDVTSSED